MIHQWQLGQYYLTQTIDSNISIWTIEDMRNKDTATIEFYPLTQERDWNKLEYENWTVYNLGFISLRIKKSTTIFAKGLV